MFSNVYFRVDSSFKIGSGHVMRCLALADYLKKKKINTYFLKRDLDGNYINKVKKHGHKVFKLKYKKTKNNNKKILKSFFYKNSLETTEHLDAQECLGILQNQKTGIIIVDHYGISKIWHEIIKTKNFRIIVIDDLADRNYKCDVLLDPTPGRKKIEYKKLINTKCKILVGINKVLLRDEFIIEKKMKKKKKLDKKLVKNVLISMGGSDLNNSSEFIIKNLEKIKLNIVITLVIGKNNKNYDKLKNLIKKFDTKVIIKRNVNNMAKLINESDLGITTPSVTAIEFCYMGLPSMTITLAKNQELLSDNLHKLGAIIKLGYLKSIKQKYFIKKFLQIFQNHQKRQNISQNSQKICQPNGKSLIYKNILRFH